MEIRSLILTDNAEPAVVETPKKKKAEVQYTIEVASGCDFAVSRKTTRSHTLLVILMSQCQFYVKDMKTGITTTLDEKELQKFLADLPETGLALEEVNWTDELMRGKKFADEFMKYLKPEYAEMAKGGFLFVKAAEDYYYNRYLTDMNDWYEHDRTSMNWVLSELSKRLNETRKSLMKRMLCGYANSRYADKITSIVMNWDTLQFISKMFGIEWMKTYFAYYMNSTCEQMPECSELKCMMLEKRVNRWGGTETPDDDAKQIRFFKSERFIEYITYDLCRQGYAINPGAFIRVWDDTLRMEEQCYGKIRDKYPEHLDSLHRVLSYLCQKNKEEIDEKKWNAAVRSMTPYEWKPENSRFQIICPKTPNDMREEARQQQNCLASYINRVINGSTGIFFLRSSSEKDCDRSLVTIEVFPDGTIGQVKARNNRTPDDIYLRFVSKWAEEKKLKYKRVEC